MNISIVIPTFNRPQSLFKCIKSIVVQSNLPKEVVVINDGHISDDLRNKIQTLLHNNNISFQYFKKNKPSSSESRNIGARQSSNEIVLFLDDDIVLEKNYIELLKLEWEKNKDDLSLGGIGGVINNLRLISFFEKIFNKIFYLSSSISWDVTSVGFQVWDPSIKKIEKVFYLSGGISSFRKSVIEKIPFRSLSLGRVALEDVDFFVRAKKQGYHFIIVPEARVFHEHSQTSKDNNYVIGEKESYGRRAIYRSSIEKSFINQMIFIWSSIGWILKQFLGGNFLKGLGMINGLFKKLRRHE